MRDSLFYLLIILSPFFFPLDEIIRIEVQTWCDETYNICVLGAFACDYYHLLFLLLNNFDCK